MALEEFTGLYYFTVDLPSHLKNQIQATAPDQPKTAEIQKNARTNVG